MGTHAMLLQVLWNGPCWIVEVACQVCQDQQELLLFVKMYIWPMTTECICSNDSPYRDSSELCSLMLSL